MKKSFTLSLALLIGMILSACSPAATAAPTVAPTEPATPSAAPTPVAQVPAGATIQKGKLTFCSDFPYPPSEFFDENGQPQGLDIEIGNEISARLGLEPVWINSVFDTIIAAVSSQKCDAILSAMDITPDRNKQVSMIPYMQAGQGFVTLKGNPEKIHNAMDLCGKAAAAQSGTTEAENLQSTGAYAGKGLSDACTQAGKEPIKAVVTQKDSDALQQLQSGKVAVYFADSPVAAYYTIQHPDQFELAGDVLDPVQKGINLPCGQEDCTQAPLTPLGEAIQTALKSMMADGTYAKILAKWNLSSSAIQP